MLTFRKSLLLLGIALLSVGSLTAQVAANISVFADHIYDVARQDSLSFREAASRVYDAGVRGVDVYVTMNPQDLQTLDATGFAHASAILVTDLVNGDGTDDIEKALDFARHHHFERILLVPGFMPDDATPDSYRTLYRRIEAFARKAAQEGVAVTVEDYDNDHSPCYNTRCLDRMFKHCHSLGLTFDTGNFCICQEDVMKACRHFSRKIKHVHLKDRKAVGQWEVAVVGTGVVPLQPFITHLLRQGYDGWFTIECYNAGHMSDAIRSGVTNIQSITTSRKG